MILIHRNSVLLLLLGTVSCLNGVPTVALSAETAPPTAKGAMVFRPDKRAGSDSATQSSSQAGRQEQQSRFRPVQKPRIRSVETPEPPPPPAMNHYGYPYFPEVRPQAGIGYGYPFTPAAPLWSVPQPGFPYLSPAYPPPYPSMPFNSPYWGRRW